MARSPYAIRKGFEYQDLVCCLNLLDLLETESLDLEFEIESDEAEHVDDLVLFDGPSSVVAKQIKFHVDQDYAESFDTVTKRRTPRSSSLLEKLYQGWKSLKETGRQSVRIEFISSNPAERGRFKLGPVIETATGRFRDKFFSHADYQRPLGAFKSLLRIEEDELRAFLADVEWRFSYESIDGLRRLTARSLKRLHLPFDDDAVSRLLELVGALATSNAGTLTLRTFVQKLWQTSRFRDACEQSFSTVDFAASQQRRANKVKVALVSLEILPALVGSRYACLEEPLPLQDYRFGISATDREGLLDLNRASWRQEYIDWLTQRVDALLSVLAEKEPDIVVFPRLSLPLQIASHVAEWGREHRVHCAVGGHSLPDSEKERALYEAGLNISLPNLEAEGEVPSDLVLDAIVRFDRAGRASISQLESPYAKGEVVISPAESIALQTADGWITAVLVPSKSVAKDYLARSPSRPELAIIAGGTHTPEVYDELAQHTALPGLPVVVCSSDAHIASTAFVLDPQAPTLRHSDSWEGLRVFEIEYIRSHTRWDAETRSIDSLPLVYHPSPSTLTPDCYEQLRGSPASRHDAIVRLQTGQPVFAIVSNSESPAEFFYRRAKEADAAIRGKLAQASTGQITEFSSKSLPAIGEQLEKLRKEAFLPQEFSPPPQKLIPRRSSLFFNRTKEKADIGQFLSPTSDKTILLLHGTPGIGKKELLTEVQRVQPDRQNWIRFRCPPNATLLEALAQLLVRLGVTIALPKQADRSVFKQIIEATEKAGATVIVFEEAHNLPISREHHDHALFLEMLGTFCSDAHRKTKLILISDWRGHLQFSGSHRMEPLYVDGLQDEYVVELLQEHLVENPCRYEQPTIDELRSLASKLHGHPFMARLAAVVLEEHSIAEVFEKLYSRMETRNFILGRLLGGIALSEKERGLLEFASILQLPVSSEAFIQYGGPSANALLEVLLNRFLMVGEEGRYRLHPVLTEFYRLGVQDAATLKRLHGLGFEYYAKLAKRRQLTVEERNEYVYHGVSSQQSLDLADMQMFAGSIRTALENAVRSRDWGSVENAARQLLFVWPYDVSGQIAMGLALDASGREHEAEQFTPSLEQVSAETLWIALEFVKSRIRKRDYDGAERSLAVVQQRFSNEPRVTLVEAQLHERKGETEEAVACCEVIVARPNVKDADAFAAALVLRDANRLDLLVKHLQSHRERGGMRNEGLLRMYSLASVLTNHDPHEGLQVLSDMWDAAPSDGYVVADYASALIASRRTADAQAVLDRGRDEVPRRSQGFRSLLETYACLFEKQGRFHDAFRMYREAIGASPNHLHLYRKFAHCLIDAAAAYRSEGRSAQEDGAVAEAKQILGKLLQMAPLDSWAADALHEVEHRAY